MNPRRLYRSRDRQLAGVAGGMAEYLDIDPTIVRILWILVGIASGGLAPLVYLVLAIVIPQAPYAMGPGGTGAWTAAPGAAGWVPAPGAPAGWSAPPAAPTWSPDWAARDAAGQAWQPRPAARGIGVGAIVGVVMIVFGAIALADAALPGWSGAALMGPAVILALGAALLVASIRRHADEVPVAGPATTAPSTDIAPQAAPAPSWDVTDTQSVDPTAFGPTGGSPADPAGQGPRPA